MKFWKINKQNLLVHPPPGHPYFDKAYWFMKSWLAGEESFSLSTSGSTGTPKVIRLSRTRLEASARLTGKTLGLGSGTRALVGLNINFVAGIMMLVRGMELDWELTVVEPSSNPLESLDEIALDFVAMAPMQLTGILANESTASGLNTIGKILLGGAPVGFSLQHEIEGLKPAVYLSYGMTETVSHVALRRLNGEEASQNYSTLDEVSIGTDARGCLWVSGPMTEFEVVQTNDLVIINDPRSFTWQGRADSIINSGGIKIQLDKIDRVVEQVLADFNFNVPFFSWYRSDEKLGQKLILVLRANRADLDADEFIASMCNHLSAYEVPKHVYFAKEFELTASGKLDKIATCKKLNIPG